MKKQKPQNYFGTTPEKMQEIVKSEARELKRATSKHRKDRTLAGTKRRIARTWYTPRRKFVAFVVILLVSVAILSFASLAYSHAMVKQGRKTEMNRYTLCNDSARIKASPAMQNLLNNECAAFGDHYDWE